MLEKDFDMVYLLNEIKKYNVETQIVIDLQED
jgi:hypothetical protein